MWGSFYAEVRSGLDSVGGGSPISYLEVTESAALIRKAGVQIPQVWTTLISTIQYLSPERPFLQPNCSLNSKPVEVEFLAWVRRTSPDYENAEETTSGLNSSLVRLTYRGIKFLPTAILPKQNWWAKNRGKIPKISKHEIDLLGQTEAFGVMRWSSTISFGMSKNRPAESLVFILTFRPHSSLLAWASTVSARPVYATAGLLAWPVRKYLIIFLGFFFWLCRLTNEYLLQ